MDSHPCRTGCGVRIPLSRTWCYFCTRTRALAAEFPFENASEWDNHPRFNAYEALLEGREASAAIEAEQRRRYQ